MSTIVTLNRGAQGMTPFGFNSGESDADRGSAFFCDFYDAGPFTLTSAALGDGACGVVDTVTASAASRVVTNESFLLGDGRSISCAFRCKQDEVTTASDVVIGGFMADTSIGVLGAYAAGATFSIGAAATTVTQIQVNSIDGSNATTTTDVTSELPAGFTATDYHVYGIEISITGSGAGTMSGQIDWFVDGKKVSTRALTYASVTGSDFDDLTMFMGLENTAATAAVTTIDWASASGPRV